MTQRDPDYDAHLRKWLNSDVPVARFLNSQEVAQERVQFAAWPFCWQCKRPVRAYGWDTVNSKYVRVWARCHERTENSPPILKPAREESEAWRRKTLRTLVFFR